MKRTDIINRVGREYLESNIENEEFSYQKALSKKGKNYTDYLADDARRKYKNLDIRFVYKNLSVLIETKQRLVESSSEADMEQLQQYVIYEKELTGNTIVAILASTVTDEIRVWQDGTNIVDNLHEDKVETVIRPLMEYYDLHFGTKKR